MFSPVRVTRNARCFSLGFYSTGKVNGQMGISEGTLPLGVKPARILYEAKCGMQRSVTQCSITPYGATRCCTTQRMTVRHAISCNAAWSILAEDSRNGRDTTSIYNIPEIQRSRVWDPFFLIRLHRNLLQGGLLSPERARRLLRTQAAGWVSFRSAEPT